MPPDPDSPSAGPPRGAPPGEDRAAGPALLVDFGSTFTKLLLVDPHSGVILARAYRPTTVEEGVEVGLRAGLAALAQDAGPGGVDLVRRASPRLACSSAAGGLRMVAVGLVRELTAAAATAAALGAGARLLRTYCHRLTPDEVEGIGAARPDVLLLAGGTDGGDRQTLLHNAAALAALPRGTSGPLVVAGNKEVTADAVATLRRAGHDARPAPNVLPSLGRLEVAPAQEAIRQVFLERIVHRKGLDGALAHLDGIVFPTPAAVLSAAALLRESPAWPQSLLGDDAHAGDAGLAGPGGPAGLAGDLVIVDVGGATTDVHSAGDGTPTRPEVYLQGLPEPRLKRTVEGDLGLRVSAPSTWEAITGRWGPAGPPFPLPPGAAGSGGADGGLGGAEEVRERLEAYAAHPGLLSAAPGHLALDAHLAAGAVALALERHAGTIEELVTPAGRFWVQRGKDLSGVALVIGSGGIFRSSAAGAGAFQAGVRAAAADPLRLAPRAPRLALDRDYVLWAAGLLAPTHPEGARRLIWRSLHHARPSY